MKTQLKDYLNRYAHFTDDDIALIFEYLEPVTFSKKQFLLKQNEICNARFFILKGLIRSFHIDEKGVENINLFAIENWWVTNLDSFVNQTPSHNALQAIEDTSVLVVSREALDILYTKIPQLERVFRIIAEKLSIALQRKDEIFMKTSSKDRYYNLIHAIPNFAQRVPQYMIASYLDITPEYLSEIRKKAK